MNNLGTENLYTDIQAMGLPVRYIKKKQPVKNTLKTPMNFVSTNPVISKKIPSHTNIQKTVIEQPYNLNKEKQSGAMIETYVPSDEIRKALSAQKQKKRMVSQTINTNRKHKESSKTVPVANNEFTDEDIIATLFGMGVIDVASYIDFEREENLKQLVAEYEAEHPSALDIATTEWRDLAITDKIKEEIAQYDAEEMAIIYNLYETGVEYAQQLRDFWDKKTNAYEQMFSSKTEAYNKELREAMDAWSKPVVVHYDFPIVSIVEENFDPKAKEKNLKALVKQYEKESRDNARKKQIAYVNTMAAEAYIKSHDAQLEQDYDCWEANRDMLNFFYNFWKQETNAYEQMFGSKTEAYNKELHEAMTPTTRKKKAYKKKNPKGKRETFVLKGGSMPKRYVAPKPACKRALKDIAALFNGARRDIAIKQNPGKIR